MNTPTRVGRKAGFSWLEVARLIAEAAHAAPESEVLLDRYDEGELSDAEFIEALRALATKH